MQVFRELYIRGGPNSLAATAEAITASLAGDWSRDAEAEEHLRRAPLGSARRAHCFRCARRGSRPTATLFLVDQDERSYYVPNIVPHDSHELSRGEYNGILEEFYHQLVLPAVARTGVTAELTDADADLERWLSTETAAKLRRFCGSANKRTGAAHPADRRVWNEFILSAHREGAEFSGSTLARWLEEAGGWDPEWADKLAIQYEYARGLLAQADGQAVGV